MASNPESCDRKEENGSVPREILFDILDALPSRDLVAVRSVSHTFFDAASSILRGRLLKTIHDPTQQLVFDSRQPASDYRNFVPQSLAFSKFESPTIVTFTMPDRASQYLILDDDCQFGSFLLSIHLQGVDPPIETSPPVQPVSGWNLPTPPGTPPETPSEPRLRGDDPDPWAPSTNRSSLVRPLPPQGLPEDATPSPVTPRKPKAYLTFSLGLAKGLDRMYRSWFEDDREGDPIWTDSDGQSYGRHALEPYGPTALKKARIDCVKASLNDGSDAATSTTFYPSPSHRTSPYSSYGSGAYTPSAPQLFQFYFKDLQVDVGRLVVSIEEGLDGRAGDRLLWMTNRF